METILKILEMEITDVQWCDEFKQKYKDNFTYELYNKYALNKEYNKSII